MPMYVEVWSIMAFNLDVPDPNKQEQPPDVVAVVGFPMNMIQTEEKDAHTRTYARTSTHTRTIARKRHERGRETGK